MSAPTFWIKQGNSRPKLMVSCDCDPTDVMDSVVFHMTSQDGTPVVDGAVAAINEQPSEDSGGIISYTWANGDTDNIGSFKGEFVVTFNDGKKESFPNWGYIQINITDTLSDNI